MSDEPKLCDVCQKRPATHQMADAATGEVSHICSVCLEKDSSYSQISGFVRKGKCKWCGAPAVGGSGVFGSGGVMDEAPNLWCQACRLDLVEFGQRPENKLADFPFDDEAAREQLLQRLADRDRRLKEFMEQRVRERPR